MYILGIVAFALFFMNDINDCRFHFRAGKLCFPVGMLLLIGASVVFAVFGNGSRCESLLGIVPIGVICALLLVAEIYSLFFSFDPSEAYDKTDKNRMVYTKKMYALCRHPGVLFFIMLYLLLSCITNMPVTAAVLFSALNLLLALFEDKIVFPAILDGYDDYKANTPFIIPNSSSVLKCIDEFRRRV